MKIVELIIDELDKISGFEAVALVQEPAIEADFFAFKSEDIEDLITLELIKLGMKEHFDETEDPGEMVIYDYQTRHYDMCPGATSLYEAILRGDHGDVDKDLVLRAAKLQDSLFYLEKHVLDMGSATEEDVLSAQNLADEIYILADMMNLREQHSYIESHVDKVKEVAGIELDIDVASLPDYIDEIKKDEFESYTDYPESATNAAKRALEWRDSHPDQDCGTRVGWARANQLANREPISEETIARMASFARHLQYEDVPYSEGCGGLMVDAWGGRAGIEWASNKLDSIREENSAETFSLTSRDDAYSFALNVDQKVLVGPLMLPDKLILRMDNKGEGYYVYFSKDTIRKIASKMMKNKLLDKMNIEHNSERPVKGFMRETWIINDPRKDKSNSYGFNLPEGTWMGMYQVEDDETWEMVKQKELKGFSIEGFFADKLIQAKKTNI